MNKPLILVVEDDTPVRNLITTTLKAHDYRFLTATNGEAAILEASSHNPEIILLDLGLPDMDGVEVIKKVRSWSNMPIIVISARSEDTDKIDALDAGGAACKTASNTAPFSCTADCLHQCRGCLYQWQTESRLCSRLRFFGWAGASFDP